MEDIRYAELKGRIMYLEELVAILLAAHPRSEDIAAFEPEFIQNLTNDATTANANGKAGEASMLLAMVRGARQSGEDLWPAVSDAERRFK